MSMIPLLFNLAREMDSDCHGGMDEWDRMIDNDFGLGINPIDIMRPRSCHYPSRRSICAPYLMGRRHRHHANNDAAANSALIPTIGKDGFQVCMDVAQFKPSELTVKTMDNTVVVEGKHEEREDDHGIIQRHFVRKYTLPKDYQSKDVVSTISSDGVLTVKAPPPPNRAITASERVVQIQQTGPAHLNLKQPDQAQAIKQAHANGGTASEKVEAAK